MWLIRSAAFGLCYVMIKEKILLDSICTSNNDIMIQTSLSQDVFYFQTKDQRTRSTRPIACYQQDIRTSRVLYTKYPLFYTVWDSKYPLFIKVSFFLRKCNLKFFPENFKKIFWMDNPHSSSLKNEQTLCIPQLLN